MVKTLSFENLKEETESENLNGQNPKCPPQCSKL